VVITNGGATVACNFGVPDRLFKRHGRWGSENAKDGYVKDSLNDLLFVSKNLGIFLGKHHLIMYNVPDFDYLFGMFKLFLSHNYRRHVI
jgi:hypothetical protein